jgi:hypothetical protein
MKKVVLRSDLLDMLSKQTTKSIIRAAPESWDEESHVLAYVENPGKKKKPAKKAKAKKAKKPKGG